MPGNTHVDGDMRIHSNKEGDGLSRQAWDMVLIAVFALDKG